jgi:hypothetical protein
VRVLLVGAGGVDGAAAAIAARRSFVECLIVADYDLGVMLGDEQFALEAAWRDAGQLALLGMGVEPGLSDVFARYAADHLFSRIDELGVRDGADLRVKGHGFAPPFSIWTLIEECLNPPVVWERGRGWFTTPPFSEPEVFDFPAGIGPLECVNVEHEEVLLMPRWAAMTGKTCAGPVGAGAGVLGPETFDAVPFLDLLTAYGSPWELREGG